MFDKVVKRVIKREKKKKNHLMSSDFAVLDSCIVE